MGVAIRAIWTFRAGCLGVLALLAGSAAAAEVKVLSAGAVKAVVPELADAFQRETGHTVQIAFDTVGALRKRAATEPGDVLILTDSAIDDLAGQGIAVAGTRTDIARVGIGVAVRQGAPLPDISTPEAFKQTLLSVKSLVYVDPAKGATSGIHFASVLQRLGIADAVKDKTLLWPGGFAAEAVAKGQAELCVHQISEILPVAGVTLVGPLPKELQKTTVYAAGVTVGSASRPTSGAFVAFLARPDFKPKLAAAGLDYKE